MATRKIPYRGRKSALVPLSTILAFVKLLEEESLLTEFQAAAQGSRIKIDPVLASALHDGTGGTAPGASISMRTAISGFQSMIARTLGDSPSSPAGDVRVKVSPRLVNVAKDFLADRKLDDRSEFAQTIVGIDRSRCPGPDYECPHIPR